MSQRFPGGFLTQSPPTPSASNTTGVWTLDQQEQLKQSGQWPPNGPFFIEDLFSTWLYTGTGSAQTITNGIDLAGKGGLVWIKARNDTTSHGLYDTARGINQLLGSNNTNQQFTDNAMVSANSNGFSLGPESSGWTRINLNGNTYASWTFREQPKFFDVVTYTGNGAAGRTVAHNLGSVPGCMIVKKTSAADAWAVYHRGVNSDTGNGLLVLNSTSAQNVNGRFWWGDNTNFIAPTSTQFTVSTDSQVNENGATYVAYLFAHNAGGFGLSGTDNVISCGSYTGSNSSTVSVNLGYEPQWVMIKRANGSGSPAWWIGDTMRGLNMQGINRLEAWTSDAESGAYNGINPTATGFDLPYGTVMNDSALSTYIYIAIRRGPMKTPTTGTSVFAPVTYTGTGATRSLTAGFPIDLAFFKVRNQSITGFNWFDRLRGTSPDLRSSGTFAELATTTEVTSFASNTQVTVGASSDTQGTNSSGDTYVLEAFQRAPGFFDEVCYLGSGVARTVAHNLTVPPELMVIKVRTPGGYAWRVYAAPLGITQSLVLNTTAASVTDTYWNGTAPTSTVFSVNDYGQVNNSGSPIVAYLFASCPGVSKVGSYTGTGTTQTINCGFTAGSRFVLIKRTDSTGDWYVWDTARGMIPANDPYLLLNSTAAEVTGTDFVDTAATGFEITSTAPAAINASGGTFIFLAIA